MEKSANRTAQTLTFVIAQAYTLNYNVTLAESKTKMSNTNFGEFKATIYMWRTNVSEFFAITVNKGFFRIVAIKNQHQLLLEIGDSKAYNDG